MIRAYQAQSCCRQGQRRVLRFVLFCFVVLLTELPVVKALLTKRSILLGLGFFEIGFKLVDPPALASKIATWQVGR